MCCPWLTNSLGSLRAWLTNLPEGWPDPAWPAARSHTGVSTLALAHPSGANASATAWGVHVVFMPQQQAWGVCCSHRRGADATATGALQPQPWCERCSSRRGVCAAATAVVLVPQQQAWGVCCSHSRGAYATATGMGRVLQPQPWCLCHSNRRGACAAATAVGPMPQQQAWGVCWSRSATHTAAES